MLLGINHAEDANGTTLGASAHGLVEVMLSIGRVDPVDLLGRSWVVDGDLIRGDPDVRSVLVVKRVYVVGPVAHNYMVLQD